jgi:hypothetical protein
MVLAKLFEAIKARCVHFWDKLSNDQREIAGYIMIVISAVLMWSTGLDMLPGFGRVWPLLGRILTCLAAGLGPSIVYDLWIDKPKPPTTPISPV